MTTWSTPNLSSMTIADARQFAVQRLLGSHADRNEALLCARLLLDEVVSTPHAHLTIPERELSTSQETQFETALSELEKGRPLAYVLGTRSFYNLSFRSDERALIPRPETELLVEAALLKLEAANSQTRSFKVADLGTGSGCIAISLAHALPQSQIYATDISPEALSLARENAQAAAVESQLHFIPGTENNWAQPLLEYSHRFDVIVSNPPYIARKEIETLQREVRDFEPRRALDGGEDGLDCYRQIAAQCGVLLRPNGALLCELGAGQFGEVRAIFEDYSWRVENPILDFAGIQRVLVAQRNP